MNEPAHAIGFRLLAAAVGTLLLLLGMVFPIYTLLGSTWGGVLPAILCIVILVILTPVVVRGSWKERLLALALAAFPALLLLSIIVFSLAFPR